MRETIFIGSDHAGFSLKQKLVDSLKSQYEIKDLGCTDEKSVDYPDYAEMVAKSVAAGAGKGILVCGSGIGMAIAANKVAGARAANVWDATSARLSRMHNDANIVCIGARLTGPEVAQDIVRTFLTTVFEEGRHQKRIDKISRLEAK